MQEKTTVREADRSSVVLRTSWYQSRVLALPSSNVRNAADPLCGGPSGYPFKASSRRRGL